ncbi:hypothetical protein PMAYCL1PPCAC_00187, partial [Pristionchus mayeri]
VDLSTEKQFESVVQIIDRFPNSKCTLSLNFLPERALLLSLPPFHDLTLRSSQQVSTDLFFKLLVAHTNIFLKNVPITSTELTSAIQIIGDDQRTRTVDFQAPHKTVTECLAENGITEAGEKCRERFDVITPLQLGLMKLCCMKCFIILNGFSWEYHDSTVNVTITNSKQ